MRSLADSTPTIVSLATRRTPYNEGGGSTFNSAIPPTPGWIESGTTLFCVSHLRRPANVNKDLTGWDHAAHKLKNSHQKTKVIVTSFLRDLHEVTPVERGQ